MTPALRQGNDTAIHYVNICELSRASRKEIRLNFPALFVGLEGFLRNHITPLAGRGPP